MFNVVLGSSKMTCASSSAIGQMLDAPRNYHELAFLQPYIAVAQLYQKTSLDDEKKLILGLVVMPHELAFQA